MFFLGKVDVKNVINLKDDVLYSKILDFYKWKRFKMFVNEDKCNSFGLERGRNY